MALRRTSAGLPRLPAGRSNSCHEPVASRAVDGPALRPARGKGAAARRCSLARRLVVEEYSGEMVRPARGILALAG